jgi:hypothetical protein
MTLDDTMDVLTGLGVLLAMALFAAAWFYTVSEWEATFNAFVAPFAVKAPASPADAALIRGLEALKKGIGLRETGTPRRSFKSGSTKWNIVKRAIS